MARERTSGIYRITCTVSGKIYIGSAQNLEKRWSQHRRLLINNAHCNKHLQRAWSKYGSEVFTWDVLEYVEDEKLIEREQYFIEHFDSCNQLRGFNILPTAGSCLGCKRSDETKAKLSAVHKGKKKSPEHIEKLRLAKLGKPGIPWTAEKSAKMSATVRGRPKSEEHRAKMRAAHLGKPLSPETCAKMSVSRRGVKQCPEVVAKRIAAIREARHRRKAEAARLKAEQRAEATFLRTGIKPAAPENPKRETQGKLFD